MATNETRKMSRHRSSLFPPLLLCAVLALSSGCSTTLYLAIQSGGTDDDIRATSTQTAGNILKLNTDGFEEAWLRPGETYLAPFGSRLLNSALLIVDYPCSLVGDVLLFPWEWWIYEHPPVE